MTLENKLSVLRRAMADLSPEQRDMCQDFLLGFVSGYVTDEKWEASISASVEVAMKCHATRGRQSNYDATDLGGEKTARGGPNPSKGAADTAGAALTLASDTDAIPVSGKDAAAGRDA